MLSFIDNRSDRNVEAINAISCLLHRGRTGGRSVVAAQGKT